MLRSELYILVSAFIGLILLFVFSYAFEYSLGYLSEFFVLGIILIFMNVIGFFIFGRKSWRFFSMVYGSNAVLFAVLMSFTESNDIVMMTTSFGLATGFALGMYKYREVSQ